jgi:hypothetical protein
VASPAGGGELAGALPWPRTAGGARGRRRTMVEYMATSPQGRA